MIRNGLFFVFLLGMTRALPAKSREVLNGPEPQGTVVDLIFEQDLSFGSKGRYLEWRGLNPAIGADDKGNMYIADTGNNRILAFDPRGAFSRVVAADGIEPGQFQGLYSFSLLEDGRGLGFEVVNGSGKLVWFNANMRYTRTTLPNNPDQVLSTIMPFPDGGRYGAAYMAVDPVKGEILLRTGILDENFKPLKILTEKTRPGFDGNRVQDLGYWVSYMASGFKTSHGGKGLTAVDGKGMVYTATTNVYTITKWSPDLKKVELVIKRKYRPIQQTGEDIKMTVGIQTARIRSSLPQSLRPMIIESLVHEAYLKADLGPVKNPIFGMLAMPEGHLLVVHDLQPKGRIDLADIFDTEGHYVGRVSLKHHGLLGTNGLPRMTFRNSMAYTIHTDDQGRHQAVRYRYRFAAK